MVILMQPPRIDDGTARLVRYLLPKQVSGIVSGKTRVGVRLGNALEAVLIRNHTVSLSYKREKWGGRYWALLSVTERMVAGIEYKTTRTMLYNTVHRYTPRQSLGDGGPPLPLHTCTTALGLWVPLPTTWSRLSGPVKVS